jgi:hypothetical protein
MHMPGRLGRLSVSVSRQIPGSQVRNGFIWGLFLSFFAYPFGLPLLIGAVCVFYCHVVAWEIDPTRERTWIEGYVQSHLWVRVLMAVVILVVFITCYPWSDLMAFIRSR